VHYNDVYVCVKGAGSLRNTSVNLQPAGWGAGGVGASEGVESSDK